MADLKEFEKDGMIYNLKDETARNNIEALQAAIGSPLVANTAASMIDTTKIYVYTGSETGYETGHWYYYNGSAWTDGGLYQSRGIAPNSVTGSKLASNIRSALLNFLQNVAMTTPNGQEYYRSLYNALNDAVVESISATFTQGNVIILAEDSLNDLKQYLTVTATYDDGSEIEIVDYELSGTLTSGTSIITVIYGNLTDTFTVTVTPSIDVTPDFSLAERPNTSGTVTWDSVNETLNVKNTTSATYWAGRVDFTYETGYTYRVYFDSEVTSGVSKVAFRNKSDNKIAIGSSNSTTGGHFVFDALVSDSDKITANPCYLSFFSTFSTSQKGDVTYSNIKVVKYMAGASS